MPPPSAKTSSIHLKPYIVITLLLTIYSLCCTLHTCEQLNLNEKDDFRVALSALHHLQLKYNQTLVLKCLLSQAVDGKNVSVVGKNFGS